MPFYTNNILLTGYWPPTNEMLRQFSPNLGQNPGGWRGRNWRGRGFDVYAFFPEFDQPSGEVGHGDAGEGDFRVDYQDTVRDWARVTRMLRPCAIVTFSRGWNTRSWEIEARARNLDSNGTQFRTAWGDDYSGARQPTPSPPDQSRPPRSIRYSTLPMEEIRDRVNGATHLGVDAYIDDSDEFVGAFVSEFIAYHGMWYRDEHSDRDSDGMCFAAGHIHVGGQVPVAEAVEATELTLEALTDVVRRRLPSTWIAEIKFDVSTVDAPTAGTDSLLTVEILRDGHHLFTGALDFADVDDHERGDRRAYRYVLDDLFLDETPPLPDGIGRIPMPYPNSGMEFSNGLEGHTQFRLRIHGDDKWIKDQVDVSVREVRRVATSFDTLAWELNPVWRRLGAWTRDVAMSRDRTEGVTTWTLGLP